jgi:electron transport complex protein RnfD
MISQRKLIVSHAPFLHCGRSVTERNYHTLLALVPAVLVGFFMYGIPAVGVVAISVSSAMIWEYLFKRVSKRPVTIGDGSAAVIGLLFAMLVPATMPLWTVIVGTFLAIVIGREIFGGIGGNSFNPIMVAVAILMVSYPNKLDFDGMLTNYDFQFPILYPIAALKHFGVSTVDQFHLGDLFLGKQIGGIGAGCGPALLAGGLYLLLRGFIRWEITVSFIVGIIITAECFHLANAARFAGAGIHLLSGYTLIGAIFLATEDSSSPVNTLPMFLYGAIGGLMTVLIRNIGAYADGVVFAILFINCINPLLDKIRPKAIGKVA